MKVLEVYKINIIAVISIANILKTSLVEYGMDHMFIYQDSDDVATNDRGIIIEKIEIEHLSTKIMVELS